MCLIKQDGQENSCDHEDCRSYYMLNRHMRLLSVPNSQGLIMQPKVNYIVNAPKESFEINHHLQTNYNTEHYQMQRFSEGGAQENGQSYQFIRFPAINNEGVIMPVPQKPFSQARTDGVIQNPGNSRYIQTIPSMNQSSNEINQSQTSVSFANFHGSHQPGSNIFNPIVSQSALNSTNGKPMKLDNVSSNESTALNLEYLKEFQSKLSGLMMSQSKIMSDLREKHEVFQETLSCLVSEVHEVKNSVLHKNPIERPFEFPQSTSTAGNTSDRVTTESLLKVLYGPDQDFQYQLVLKNDLQLPFYRERNFSLTIMLVDKNGNVVENINRIPLAIGIYSTENPPKLIETNTAGNKIFKGIVEKELANGFVKFEKIQINEVTSHFRNGWVFFVVYPKSMQNNVLTKHPKFVPVLKVKPLVLEKVIVKAKKMKETKNVEETEQPSTPQEIGNRSDKAEQNSKESESQNQE